MALPLAPTVVRQTKEQKEEKARLVLHDFKSGTIPGSWTLVSAPYKNNIASGVLSDQLLPAELKHIQGFEIKESLEPSTSRNNLKRKISELKAAGNRTKNLFKPNRDLWGSLNPEDVLKLGAKKIRNADSHLSKGKALISPIVAYNGKLMIRTHRKNPATGRPIKTKLKELKSNKRLYELAKSLEALNRFKSATSRLGRIIKRDQANEKNPGKARRYAIKRLLQKRKQLLTKIAKFSKIVEPDGSIDISKVNSSHIANYINVYKQISDGAKKDSIDATTRQVNSSIVRRQHMGEISTAADLELANEKASSAIVRREIDANNKQAKNLNELYNLLPGALTNGVSLINDAKHLNNQLKFGEKHFGGHTKDKKLFDFEAMFTGTSSSSLPLFFLGLGQASQSELNPQTLMLASMGSKNQAGGITGISLMNYMQQIVAAKTTDQIMSAAQGIYFFLTLESMGGSTGVNGKQFPFWMLSSLTTGGQLDSSILPFVLSKMGNKTPGRNTGIPWGLLSMSMSNKDPNSMMKNFLPIFLMSQNSRNMNPLLLAGLNNDPNKTQEEKDRDMTTMLLTSSMGQNNSQLNSLFLAKMFMKSAPSTGVSGGGHARGPSQILNTLGMTGSFGAANKPFFSMQEMGRNSSGDGSMSTAMIPLLMSGMGGGGKNNKKDDPLSSLLMAQAMTGGGGINSAGGSDPYSSLLMMNALQGNKNSFDSKRYPLGRGGKSKTKANAFGNIMAISALAGGGGALGGADSMLPLALASGGGGGGGGGNDMMKTILTGSIFGDMKLIFPPSHTHRIQANDVIDLDIIKEISHIVENNKKLQTGTLSANEIVHVNNRIKYAATNMGKLIIKRIGTLFIKHGAHTNDYSKLMIARDMVIKTLPVPTSFVKGHDIIDDLERLYGGEIYKHLEPGVGLDKFISFTGASKAMRSIMASMSDNPNDRKSIDVKMEEEKTNRANAINNYQAEADFSTMRDTFIPTTQAVGSVQSANLPPVNINAGHMTNPSPRANTPPRGNIGLIQPMANVLHNTTGIPLTTIRQPINPNLGIAQFPILAKQEPTNNPTNAQFNSAIVAAHTSHYDASLLAGKLASKIESGNQSLILSTALKNSVTVANRAAESASRLSREPSVENIRAVSAQNAKDKQLIFDAKFATGNTTSIFMDRAANITPSAFIGEPDPHPRDGSLIRTRGGSTSRSINTQPSQ